MKMRGRAAVFWALTLAAVLLLPTQTYAAEQKGSGVTTLKTTVPDAHTVLLDIGEYGSVTVGKEIYTGTQEIQVK